MSEEIRNKLYEALTKDQEKTIKRLLNYLISCIESIGNGIYKYTYHETEDLEHIIEVYSNNYDDLIDYIINVDCTPYDEIYEYNENNIIVFAYPYYDEANIKQLSWICKQPNDKRYKINGKYSDAEWCERIGIKPETIIDKSKTYILTQFQVEQYVRYYFS